MLTSFLICPFTEQHTCILLIIINCSTSGCVSPVKFIVPSSMMKAWIDGKEAWRGGSHCSDSIRGILGNNEGTGMSTVTRNYVTVKLKLRTFCSVSIRQPHLFTSVKLSSNLACSAELFTLPRPSVRLSTACSTLLQEPVE